MSIIIKGVTKQDTAYDKRITFEYEGEEYSGILHWDSYDGYYLMLDNEDDPKWVTEWNEDEHDGESLMSVLDQLTDKVIEESYL